ncbi:TBC1 domain member 7 [Mactra antiquata]
MADERNFRSYYYEKVGFRAVEEKKSIELLLKEKPLDVEKLRQYCLRFPVSARYRIYLWKLVLGVIPANQESHDFVMKNRTEQYNTIRRALEIMRKIDKETPDNIVFLKMFLIEEGRLPLNDNKIMLKSSHRIFACFAEAMLAMVESPVDAYWMSKNFYRMTTYCSHLFVPDIDKIKQLLSKEDGDQKLIKHLDMVNVWNHLPLKEWFGSCFCSVLPEASFERVGDKVLGGSTVILTYVTVALFMTLKRPLLSMTSAKEMCDYLAQVPEDSGDILVSKGIDIWEKHGHHLTKSESPGPQNRSPISISTSNK